MEKRASIVLILASCLALLAARAQQSSTPQQSSPTKSQKPEAAQATPPAAQSQDASPFKSQTEKISYAIGMNLARSLSNNSVEVDLGALEQGLKDALAGGKTLLTVPELQATLAQVQADIRKRQQEKMEQLAETNRKEGDAFLNANKSKDGVVVLPSGLQYKILREGTGTKPTASDTVTCNYRGTLLDGTEFDSSYKHGAPATFAVARIIKGWIEALQLMPTGSKWQIFIPSDLAYGERGSGPTIGPNATLIYEVELLSVQAKPEAKPERKPEPEPEPKTNPTPNLNPHSSPTPNPK